MILLVTVPISIYAIVVSLNWIGKPFPGFFVANNGVISNVSGYGWPPDRGAAIHSQVLAIEGRPLRSNAEVYDHAATLPLGTPVTYSLRRDGKEFLYSAPTRRFTIGDYLQTCGILLLFGLLSLSFALAVGLLQPHTTQARVYLYSVAAAGVYPITGTLLYQPQPATILTTLYLVSEAFFPALWIHLALVFPVARGFVGTRKRLLALPYVISAVLAVAWVRGYYAQPPRMAAVYAISFCVAVAIAFFYGAMIYAYWENREPSARSRVRVTLPSLMLATLLPLIVFTEAAYSGNHIPIQFALVLSPIFYASVAYSIAVHDLFDVDRFVRQSFVYGLLTVIILATYALLLAVSMRLVPDFAARNQALLSAAFVLLVAFGLDPLRRAVQNTVDRAFYRKRLDSRATIRELSGLMTTLLDQRAIADQVTRVVSEAMQLEVTTIGVLDLEIGPGTIWFREMDGKLRQREGDSALAALASGLAAASAPLAEAGLRAWAARTPDGEKVGPLLDELQARLVLPLVSRGKAVGVLVMGPRRSRLPFSVADIDLLRTLANQIAIALQNARSYQALGDLTRDLDQKVRRQTEQLQQRNQELTSAYDELKDAQAQLIQSEKMASLGQLVAGVAHELNNPASFVHGSLANLEEYVKRFTIMLEAYEQAPIADPAARQAIDEARRRTRLDYLLRETPDLLRISTEGTQRIKQIVDDLRTFARADQGHRTLTDLSRGLNSTVGLLSNRIQAMGVALKQDYQPNITLEANAGQLNQVWMNLLSNALDAVEGRPNPEICITARSVFPDFENAERRSSEEIEAGFVDVEVRDNGCGISADVESRIFEPFFTTKPSGKGTGLGLSIAYGAVKSHAGTINVDSFGSGTVVTVRLPASRKRAHAV